MFQVYVIWLFALSDHTGVVLAQNDQITYTWNICYT